MPVRSLFSLTKPRGNTIELDLCLSTQLVFFFQHCSISIQWHYYQMTNRCWKKKKTQQLELKKGSYCCFYSQGQLLALAHHTLPTHMNHNTFNNAARCCWNLGRPTTRGSPWLLFPIRAAQHPAQGLSKVPAASRCWLNYQSTRLILHLVWILKRSGKVCRPIWIDNFKLSLFPIKKKKRQDEYYNQLYFQNFFNMYLTSGKVKLNEFCETKWFTLRSKQSWLCKVHPISSTGENKCTEK